MPDARGRVSAGKDDMGGVAAGRLTAEVSGVAGATLGANGGDQRTQGHTHTGSGQTGNAGAHSHSGSGTTSGGGDHVHSYEDQYRTVDGGTASTVLASGTNRALQTSYSTKSTAWAGNHSHTYSFNTSNADAHSHSYSFTTSRAGDGASQNVQPTLILNKIIRL